MQGGEARAGSGREGEGEDFRNYGTALVPRDSSSVDGKAPGPCLHGHDNAILIMHVNWFPSPA